VTAVALDHLCTVKQLSSKKMKSIMKRFFLTAITALLFAVQLNAGSSENATNEIRSIFQRYFGEETKATWSKKDGIYTASFKKGDTDMHAFFDEENNYLGVGQYFDTKKTPAGIVRQIEQRFPGNIIYQAYEYNPVGGGIIYGFLISDGQKARKLKVDMHGELTVMHTSRK
jgi:hypothetical protein